MNLLNEIRDAWGWAGIDPVEVVGENDFGNLIVKAGDGQYWRLTPDDCECKVVAGNRSDLDRLSSSQNFRHDWYMTRLVEAAREKCGALPAGWKYSLKVPALLGGDYGGENLTITSLIELVRVSGKIARETRDLPDVAEIRLTTSD